MRKLFVAGNWKMNLDADGGTELAGQLKAQVGDIVDVTVAVCPPFVYLQGIAEELKGSRIGVGAQNMYPESEGAYTGEISGLMLRDVGCRYVILGHSERRHVMGEEDGFINQKVRLALELGLEPILCIGEKLEQRQAGETEDVVVRQVEGGLEGVTESQMAMITLAYEPVWAIGTGVTATPDQAEEVHAMVRGLLGQLYGSEIADSTVIQYGGSVKPGNAEDLLSMPNVDGALVGGASLQAELFVPIVQAAQSVEK
jgi:triosephosphate isomerase